MIGRRFRYYEILVHIFVVVLLISNLVGQKIAAIGPFRISGAQVLFPVTYIFGDIFTEVYGYGASRRAIWIGFFASGLLAAMGMFTVWLPPAPGWDNQQAFATVFGFVPRMVAASLVAFWCGEFANSFVMAKMKIWTGGRMLWSRTIGSTVVGQFVDTTMIMVLGVRGQPESGVDRQPDFLRILRQGSVRGGSDSFDVCRGQLPEARRGRRPARYRHQLQSVHTRVK